MILLASTIVPQVLVLRSEMYYAQLLIYVRMKNWRVRVLIRLPCH